MPSERSLERAKGIAEFYFGDCACETGDTKTCEGCKISRDIAEALDEQVTKDAGIAENIHKNSDCLKCYSARQVAEAILSQLQPKKGEIA